MNASSSLITVPGRILNSPRIGYGQKKQAQVMGGSWNMVPRGAEALKFSVTGSMQRWACVYIDHVSAYPRQQTFTLPSMTDIVKKLTLVLRDCGMNVAPAAAPKHVNLNSPSGEADLEQIFRAASGNIDLILFIVPATPIPLYNVIKRLGDVKYGIHTICTVGSKLAKGGGQDQYLRNVALKFNLKLGGSNQLIEPANLGLVADGKTMVVGIDVTHPSPGSALNAPSVAGMVASVSGVLGQWPGILSIQSQARKEMVSHLGDMLKTRLRLWREREKARKGTLVPLPENILIYRDGVSEGQYQLVVDNELPLLRSACKDVYSPAETAKGLPRLTLVIVGKRHHTRFYPTKDQDADKSGNTKAGTVVDRGVTEARSWDFFLQAHAALQGTVRPGHYYVLLDEIFRSKYPPGSAGGPNAADRLQDLTQSMCYVFGRATKAVSLCTPAYYADIMCERARCYLSSMFDTPSNSAAPSVAGSTVAGGAGGAGGASQDDVKIHPRLCNTMFYI